MRVKCILRNCYVSLPNTYIPFFLLFCCKTIVFIIDVTSIIADWCIYSPFVDTYILLKAQNVRLDVYGRTRKYTIKKNIAKEYLSNFILFLFPQMGNLLITRFICLFVLQSHLPITYQISLKVLVVEDHHHKNLHI